MTQTKIKGKNKEESINYLVGRIKTPTQIGILLWRFQFIVSGISSQLEISSLRKLVSYGGLDLTIHCLAPFEISVLGGRMPAFLSQRDPQRPWWERRGDEDLPCVLLLWQLAPPPSYVPQQAGPAGSMAMVTFRRAMQCMLWISAVILLGISLFIVFVGGEP